MFSSTPKDIGFIRLKHGRGVRSINFESFLIECATKSSNYEEEERKTKQGRGKKKKERTNLDIPATFGHERFKG